MRTSLDIVQGQNIVQEEDGSFSFIAGMTIDADGSPRCYGPNDSGLDATICAGHNGNWWGVVTDTSGNPVIQGPNDPAPGFYVSHTSLQNTKFLRTDPRRYLNAEEIAFVVVPSTLARACKGIVLGCKVKIENYKTQDQAWGVCGDIGPASHLGEVSVKMASTLGIPSSPRTGGEARSIFRYTFFPGIAARGYELQPL